MSDRGDAERIRAADEKIARGLEVIRDQADLVLREQVHLANRIRLEEEKIRERAQLIARMLLGDNEAAKAQAVQAIERGCRAEEVLSAVRSLPSVRDLMTNPVARAMYEVAGRAHASTGASR